jgi:hypothetical protein
MGNLSMSKKKLIDDIKVEIKNLERLDKEMKDLLVKIKEEPSFIEIRETASIGHAPVSWVLGKKIEDMREVLNLSEEVRS